MKVAIFSQTPIAGAPYLQYHCLKKYADIDVRHIAHRNKYADGRVFPKDLLITESTSKRVIRQADVIHVHNYLPNELKRLINPKHQKVIATFHSCPRQGNWKALFHYAHKCYCIRQPMQLREYKDFDSLPNMFDIWDWKAPSNQTWNGKINIVYCPTNKHPNNLVASKGFHTVLPLLKQLETDRSDVSIIHHTGMEYFRNLKTKQAGHIVIDDVIGSSWHLTSIEGGCFGQVVLTSASIDLGFPWVYTNLNNLKQNLLYYLDNKEKAREKGLQIRTWLESNWNPKELVKEYLEAYNTR